jgi:RNA polymerase sigma-70 factor (ECF subfamily)
MDWLADHGEALLRYAAARLADLTVAEDLVQETFLAALEGYDRFREQAAVRTWLVGILRRKLADHYRRLAKQRGQRRGDDPEAQQPSRARSPDDPIFDEHGIWRTPIARWPLSPTAALENKEFWPVLHECLGKLPPHSAAAFILRVVDELESAEVCSILDITPTNLSVRLHRARVALRECVGRNWFGETRSGPGS